MNIFLWVIQGLVAFQSISGVIWRHNNYDHAAQSVASLKALPESVWSTIGVFELVFALGLILPGLFKLSPKLTPSAALGLTLVLLIETGIHLYYGVPLAALFTGWAMLASLFIAYGRFVLRPLK
ncbi:MAG TPA: DoxX family protein [bacterium]|jgi:hypothetical protein|nr:DoxX family protein [bacterium]